MPENKGKCENAAHNAHVGESHTDQHHVDVVSCFEGLFDLSDDEKTHWGREKRLTVQ